MKAILKTVAALRCLRSPILLPPRAESRTAVPNVELVLVDGKRVHLADLRGQVVVLNYWATWCVPCRAELPLLDAYFWLREAGWPLKIFAVATEDSVPKNQLKKLFSVLSISPTDHIRGGPFAYIEALPTNFVIDRSESCATPRPARSSLTISTAFSCR